MEAGDSVLQPPHIRHRVLESSPGLEVLEVTSPAEHPTLVDHDLTLPTADLRADRDFAGQRFVRHPLSTALWLDWGSGFEVADTGIGVATGDLVGARTVRVSGSGSALARTRHDAAEQLVNADTDAVTDIYERSGGQTTLVSTGPSGGDTGDSAGFMRASADGTRVFFQTRESLISADTDATIDVYERSGGQTTLVTTGSNADAFFSDMSADGKRVFFYTHERLVSADTDDFIDVYERSGGQTTLVSTGPEGGNGAGHAQLFGRSADGTRAFFQTAERLVSADTDQQTDVYERSGGQTTLISTAGSPLEAAFFAGASTDGSRVFYQTVLLLGPVPQSAIWERSGGGQTTLVVSGAAFQTSFAGASADGTRVLFVTEERLVSADTDTAEDHLSTFGRADDAAHHRPHRRQRRIRRVLRRCVGGRDARLLRDGRAPGERRHGHGGGHL
jgi:hypothetical protein